MNESKTNVCAIIGFILSMIGFFVIPLIFSTGGLITGIIGYTKVKELGRGKALAIWAIVIGAVGLAYGIFNLFIRTLGINGGISL